MIFYGHMIPSIQAMFSLDYLETSHNKNLPLGRYTYFFIFVYFIKQISE